MIDVAYGLLGAVLGAAYTVVGIARAKARKK